MDGEQNSVRVEDNGAGSVAARHAAPPRVDGDGADRGDSAGSIGGGDAGGDVPAGGDAGGGDQPAGAAAAGPAAFDGDEAVSLDWKNNESDAEAVITWARYHAGDQPGKAIHILTTLAENQSLGIRNGDTPVRNNAKTALRDVLAQAG